MEAASVEQHISRVGQELKRWEQQFAASHGGSKPTRHNIKQEPEIAAKYSEYHRLRASRPSKPAQQNQSHSSPQRPKKLKANPQPSTPSKRVSKTASTPLRTNAKDAFSPSPKSPNDENATPPAARTFVGPTPQKDGRVLGLFDVLLEDNTPSKDQKEQDTASRSALETLSVNAIASTPTKRTQSPAHVRPTDHSALQNSLQATMKYSRTPQSSGKRFLLDTFVTPSKRCRLSEAATPQSCTKLTDSATPAFLQRTLFQLTSLPEYASAEDVVTRNDPSRWPTSSRAGTKRKPLTRSFSSMIAEIRQAEDDRLDEELEMLREMEGDIADDNQLRNAERPKENVQVADSQALHILGPDGSGPLSDDEGEQKAGLGRDGRPLKVWKKKGQKRQTRRVIMRPVKKSKPLDPVIEEQPSDESTDNDNNGNIRRRRGRGDGDHVAEVQPAGDDDDCDDSGLISDAGDLELPRKRRKTSSDDKSPTTNTEVPKQHHEGVVKKAAKKISATAHANFRRLKIRSSKGAKAASKGRFGRGRR